MKKDKILKHFDSLLEEVRDLVYSLDVWNKLTDIQKKSSQVKNYGGHLWHWLAQNYTYKVIIQITKITNPNYKDDDINFIKLLNDIKVKKYISFERFLQSYNIPVEKERRIYNVIKNENFKICDMNFTLEDAKKDFENKTNFPYNHTDFSEMINQDIQKLDDIFQKIKIFRNKKIAHLTPIKITNVPTYANIENSINTIKNIAQKYNRILYHCHDSFHYIDLNITKVFEKAWIEKT